MVKFWAKTQTCVALSSAESEGVAIVKGASEAIGVQRLCTDLKCPRRTLLHADASAALGLADNNGLGRARHIDIGVLWLQLKRLRRELELAKILGTENQADLMTKHLDRHTMDKHFETLSFVRRGGRAETATSLYSMSVISDNAVKSDGSVITWRDTSAGGNTETFYHNQQQCKECGEAMICEHDRN